MKVRMLETRRGSDNGYKIVLYMKGETYEVGDSLGRAFIASGFARRVPVRKAKSKPTEH